MRWILVVAVVVADGDAAADADEAATEVAETASAKACTCTMPGMARYFSMGWMTLTLPVPSLDLRR